MNCFLACSLPDASGEYLATYVQSVLSPLTRVQWVSQEKFHITTEFFGNRDSKEFSTQVRELVEPICKAHPPVELLFGNLGTFPHRDNPHAVLYAGIVDTTSALGELVMEIRDVLGHHGIAGERSSFVPHCTIGRTHHPLGAESAAVWRAASVETIGGSSFTIAGLSLMQTVPGNAGSQYVCVAELPFQAQL